MSFASENHDLSGADSREALTSALELYRRKSRDSNVAFWTAKIDALQQDDSLSDSQRLDILAPYFELSKWPRTGYASSVTSPAQLLIPPHEPGHVDLGIFHDGTIPATEQKPREQFLQQLREILMVDALPAEYGHLLELTDAISDLDFAQTGTAGLRGVCGGLPTASHLSSRLPEQYQWQGQGWMVEAGWQCGVGNMSATQILRACRPDSSVKAQKVFKWRIFAYDRQNFDGLWFETIADWLMWKADWLERPSQGRQTQGVRKTGNDGQEDESDDSGHESGEE